MKKWLPVLFLALGSIGWGLDWELPVWSLRTDLASGSAQDAEESTLEPESARVSVTLKVSEQADPLSLALALTGTLKDCLDTETGDYHYVKLEQHTGLEAGDRLDLGFDLAGKRMVFTLPDTDLRSKDYTLLLIGADARLAVAESTSLSVGLDGRWEWWDAPEKSRQVYAGTLSLASRLGSWQLSARYRLEARLPMESAPPDSQSLEQSGAFAVSWDPNRTP